MVRAACPPNSTCCCPDCSFRFPHSISASHFQGLSAGKFDIAYIHPSHIALKGLAQDGYQPVALTKGYTDYRAHFLVRSDSGAHNGTDPVSYVSTRYQDAIPFMVEHGLVDAGVTGSDSVAKAWTQAGGRIAFTSKSVPVKLMLASSIK